MQGNLWSRWETCLFRKASVVCDVSWKWPKSHHAWHLYHFIFCWTWTGWEDVSFLSSALLNASLHTCSSLPTAPRSQLWPTPLDSSPMSIGSIQPLRSDGSAIIASKSSRSSASKIGAESMRRANTALPSSTMILPKQICKRNPLVGNILKVNMLLQLSFAALPLIVLFIGRVEHHIDVLCDVTSPSTVPVNMIL